MTEAFDPISRPLHYNRGRIEVWNYIADRAMNYFEGNIVKYVARYAHKNGIEDLKKALAYTNKLISLVRDHPRYPQPWELEGCVYEPLEFILDQGMGFLEGKVVVTVSTYKTVNDLMEVRECLENLIQHHEDVSPK